MQVRFTTAVADASHGAFHEGRVITLDPSAPDWPFFEGLLRSGAIVPDRTVIGHEVALAPGVAEQAIARRSRAARTRRPSRTRAVAAAKEADVASVPMLCPGGTVACLATGPSLTADDVKALRGTVDAVIAVNDAWRLAPWADALMASDVKWWKHHDGVPTFRGLKYCLQQDVPSGVAVLEHTGQRGIETDPTGLRSGMNSGAAAINLAVHFGATRILLLGYDMGATGSGHFFGKHPPQLQIDSPYPSFIEMFRTMVEPLTQLGIEVVNCTRETALDMFPQMPLADALRTRKAVA